MKHNNKKDICYQVQDGLAMVCKSRVYALSTASFPGIQG